MDSFVRIAPAPRPRPTDQGEVRPEDPAFSGFVFKIHANLDPNHRDRIAFLRVFGPVPTQPPYRHVRLGKDLRICQPHGLPGSPEDHR